MLFVNDIYILKIIERSIPVDFENFIIKTNIINYFKKRQNDSGLTTDRHK